MGLLRELNRIFPSDRVLSGPVWRHALSRDASSYRLLPRAIVRPEHEGEIQTLLRYAQSEGVPVVFRAGGTSLSGQAITDSILVEIKQGFQQHEIHDGGATITLGAGVTGARANQLLRPYGRRIGPDPGSLSVARMGGIIANNASGISSGVKHTAYTTLQNLRCILPGGQLVDTALRQAARQFKADLPRVVRGLLEIRDEIRRDPNLTKLIQHRFRLKNTMGLQLNAFLDHASPADILAHLMVGSEGTLGFVSRATLVTRPLPEHYATSLLLFSDIETAMAQVAQLKTLHPEALELMDTAALRSVRGVRGIPPVLQTELPDGTAALLLEFASTSSAGCKRQTAAAKKLLQQSSLLRPMEFVEDSGQRETLWKVRRELGALHAGLRPGGTSIISEDVCFPMEALAEAARDLQHLLLDHEFGEAAIFGHAGDGNLHFKLTADFQQPGFPVRYRAFMDKLADLVVDQYDGSLKAEHGTGRNMAPFLEKQWGSPAVELMRRVKTLLDPAGILNPDVIFTERDLLHLDNLKTIPEVHEHVDNCIECGLCEPVCPSANLTLTPRQRITALREMTLLSQGDHGDQLSARALQREFAWLGIDTCARDGMCSIACPLDIDTGRLMKVYEAHGRSRISRQFALWLSRHFAGLSAAVRLFLRIMNPVSSLFRNETVHRFGILLNRYSFGVLPGWNADMQGAARPLPDPPRIVKPRSQVLYFPTCLTRTMQVADPGAEEKNLSEALFAVLEAAGIEAAYPQGIRSHCCGLSFHSRGHTDAATLSAGHLVDTLFEETDGGKLPILVDTSPCTRFIRQYDRVLTGVTLAKWRCLKFHDIVDYLHDEVLPELTLNPLPGQAVLHPTCSTREMGNVEQMRAIAEQCVEEVVIPVDAGCCAFAGDRGLRIPALTAAASTREAKEVQQYRGDAGHYSTSRTCEIGMTQATGSEYRALIHLVYKALMSTE